MRRRAILSCNASQLPHFLLFYIFSWKCEYSSAKYAIVLQHSIIMCSIFNKKNFIYFIANRLLLFYVLDCLIASVSYHKSLKEHDNEGDESTFRFDLLRPSHQF